MKSNRNLILILLLLIVVAAVCRTVGFAPQLAMALFAGAVIKDKKWAFAFPIFSMFVGDLLYQVLYMNGLTVMPGFYNGQVTNYLLFGSLVAVGFLMKRVNLMNVILFSLSECAIFFILSNFFVWINGGGWGRPMTVPGLIQCYADAIPFFGDTLLSTLVCSGILFGAYRLLKSESALPATLASK